MAIAKASFGKGFSTVINYVMTQKDVPLALQPVLLECNNLRQGEPHFMARQMLEISKDHATTRPVMHVPISFNANEKITDEQAEKAINSILSDIGVDREKHQFIIVEHFDKPNTRHFHCVVNRVDLDAKLLPDTKIVYKLQVACDKAEVLQGLERTPNRTVKYDPSKKLGYRYATKEEKRKIVENRLKEGKKPQLGDDKRPQEKLALEEIEGKIAYVLESKKILAKTPEEFKEKLAENGVEVRFSYDRKNDNAIRGASFKSDKITVKGGQIGVKWDYINAHLEHNKAQSLGIDHVSPPVQQSFKAEQKAKETTLNPISPVAQVKTAREEIAEKAKTNLDQEIAPGATPIETPLVQQPTANDFIAKKKWEDKYLYRGNNPDPKGTINNVAINETFKLALEMKSSMPKLANYSDEQIADQAIRLSMGNYKMGTFHNDKFITLSNPWDKWEKIRGKDHYEQLVKIVAEQKRGEIIILAENTKIESINQKIDIEEEKEQKLKGGMGLR